MQPELYEEHATLERDHWWFVARRSIIATVLEHHLPPDPTRRILDVGCGTGGMLPMLGHFGQVEGLEGDALAYEHCRHEYASFDVQLGAIPDDVPTNGSFDVVTAFDVIEHIPDDQGALEAMRAAVRPGGLIVVTVPALPRLWSQHDDVNGHQRRYTRHSLEDVLGRARLELLHISYFNTVLLPVVMAARLGQRLRPRPVAPHSDFSMPPDALNRVLRRLMTSERAIVSGRGLPLGVSLIAGARRRA